ncbi:MAG: hypothetical protein U9P73_09685 [Candidatus Cloacimonadota bacterium]|nr:hypothetical protein [Candidatus Cloacimonadota bacterium]
MNRIIVIIICLVMTSFVFSDELEMDVKKQTIYTSILSPGLFTTLGLGIGSVSPSEKVEKLVIIHAGLAPMFLGGGIYSQTRYFKDSTRTGMFYTFDIGVDVILGAGADPGGGSAGFITIPFPNIAGGIGYSTKIGENSYLRISIDAGIKAVISNINLSVTF